MPFPDRVRALSEARAAILPSMLLCDFGHLAREIERLVEVGVDGFHWDVMDGEFVPNLTYGMPIVAAARQVTDLPLDVHLMIAHPGRYVRAFAEAGADIVTFHVEARDDPAEVLAAIHREGMAAGLACNPATPLSRIEPYLDKCDVVLVMSVPAGFGGQPFDRSALTKLAALRQWAAGENRVLEIDGGIHGETIADAVAQGADWLVVGSAIFRSDNYESSVKQLRRAAEPALAARSST